MHTPIITCPPCGATVFDDSLPSREDASSLAHEHYEGFALEPARDGSGAYYAVKVGPWYRAMAGTIGGCPAILHKGEDGVRTLHVYPHPACAPENLTPALLAAMSTLGT